MIKDDGFQAADFRSGGCRHFSRVRGGTPFALKPQVLKN
jgi:hypothetical protein